MPFKKVAMNKELGTKPSSWIKIYMQPILKLVILFEKHFMDIMHIYMVGNNKE